MEYQFPLPAPGPLPTRRAQSRASAVRIECPVVQYRDILSYLDELKVAAENGRDNCFGRKCLYCLRTIDQHTRSCHFPELVVKYLFKPFTIVAPAAMKRAFQRFQLFQKHGIYPHSNSIVSFMAINVLRQLVRQHVKCRLQPFGCPSLATAFMRVNLYFKRAYGERQ